MVLWEMSSAWQGKSVLWGRQWGARHHPMASPTAQGSSTTPAHAESTHPTMPSHLVSFKQGSSTAAFWWCFPSCLGVAGSEGASGREVGIVGLRSTPTYLLGAHHGWPPEEAKCWPQFFSSSSSACSPAVMHMCFVHKYIILCSCQPRLIGLMFPEEQPKATLAADVWLI